MSSGFAAFDEIVHLSRCAADDYEKVWQERDRLKRNSPYRQVVVVTCMDERCRSFEDDLGLPLGYFEFMRTKGAKIHLSNFEVRDTLSDLRKYEDDDRPVLLVLTVHYSEKFPKQGCAGWNNDTSSAFRHQMRVATSFARRYLGFLDVLVVGYNTDNGQVDVFPDEVEPLVESGQFAFAGSDEEHGNARKRLFSELSMWLRCTQERWSDPRVLMNDRETHHCAVGMHVGSGFEFVRENGSAVLVGLRSSTLIDDIALGVEKIIMPEASRRGETAYIIVNRRYRPDLDGERLQAQEWVDDVIEDIMCLFGDDVDAGHLRIMGSISTLKRGLESVMYY